MWGRDWRMPVALMTVMVAGCGHSEPPPSEYQYVFRVYYPKGPNDSMLRDAAVATIEYNGKRYETGKPITVKASEQFSAADGKYVAVVPFETCGAVTVPLELQLLREDYERKEHPKAPISVNLVLQDTLPTASDAVVHIDNRKAKEPAKVAVGTHEITVAAGTQETKTVALEPCAKAHVVSLNGKEIGALTHNALIDTSGTSCYLQLTASYADAPSTLAKLDKQVFHSLEAGEDLFKYPPLIVTDGRTEMRSIHDCASRKNLEKYNITEIAKRSQ